MLSLVRAFLDVNINFFHGMIKILIPKVFDKLFFCYAFNTLAAFKRRKIRFSYDNQSQQYLALEGSIIKRFMVKQQNLYSYQDGFTRRAQRLSDTYQLHLIDFSVNDLIIDCGANNGDFLMALESNLTELNYIAFEPSPVEFKTLRENIGNHLAVNMALGDADRTVDLFLSEQNADSSLVPSSYNLPSTKVRMITLQSFVRETLADTRIKLLKVEAEGYEPEVLQGAQHILNQIDYVVVDGGFERGPDKQPTLPVVSNMLIKSGFTMLSIGGGNRLVGLFKNNKN